MALFKKSPTLHYLRSVGGILQFCHFQTAMDCVPGNVESVNKRNAVWLTVISVEMGSRTPMDSKIYHPGPSCKWYSICIYPMHSL